MKQLSNLKIIPNSFRKVRELKVEGRILRGRWTRHMGKKCEKGSTEFRDRQG